MYWWIIRILVYVWNKWCVYFCEGDTEEYIIVGLDNSVNRSQTFAVGLNCLHHLATLVTVNRRSKGSYLEYYLVIFCMYVFRTFHSRLRRGDTPGAHNWSPYFLLRLWGKYFTGSYSGARYKFVCYVLYMLWLVCIWLINQFVLLLLLLLFYFQLTKTAILYTWKNYITVANDKCRC